MIILILYHLLFFYFYSFHPYLFFNKDQMSITFMGFCINDKGDAIDPNSGKIILPQVMSVQLKNLLLIQRAELSENYCNW